MEVKKHNIKIEELTSDIELIKGLRSLIYNEYHMLFHAVIVHGSVGTNEIIPYSDFDGLLIVKDEHVNSSDLKKFKKESMKLILKFDPLQHHGWFEIKVGDLSHYPESYLPISILEYSKLIYPKQDSLDFVITTLSDVDYKTHLIKLLNRFEERILNKWEPNNVYELKSILSQIMLIPCLYYSAVHNKGIFKANSFEAVKSDFDSDEWMPIELSSQIRASWCVKFNPFQRLVIGIQNPIFRKITRKFFIPKIDKKTKALLDERFYSNLLKLVQKIKTVIE